MISVDFGDTIRLRFTFRDFDDGLVDPTNPEAKILSPAGVLTDLAVSPVSEGVVDVEHLFDEAGCWTLRVWDDNQSSELVVLDVNTNGGVE